MAEVLLVDDEVKYARILARVLEGEGHGADTARSPAEALEKVKARAYDVVVSDIRMPGMDGVELLRALRELSPETDLVLMTAFATVETAVEAIRLGVRDYLLKPFQNQELIAVVNRLAHVRSLEAEHADRRSREEGLEPLGEAPAQLQARETARKLADSDVTVLLRGETGTGKEVFARFVHARSPRAGEPFIALNVAVLPRDLLEAELFGHEKGAFTGADQARMGKLEAAGRGTLFLDEIGELPLELQAKLLRVLEAREYRRLGGIQLRRFPARILAATHRDLEEAVREGTFREDLYFRLNVAELVLPPLRERTEDVERLSLHLLERHGHAALTLAPETLERLRAYPWPGNVRELANVLQRAALLAEGDVLRPEHLHLRALRAPEPRRPPAADGPSSGPPTDGEGFPEEFQLEEWELRWVERAMEAADGVKTEAARLLGISRRALDSRLRRLEDRRAPS